MIQQLRLYIMVFWTMLIRMPLQPRGNIPITANITFLEDSLGQYRKKLPISVAKRENVPPTIGTPKIASLSVEIKSLYLNR